MKKVILIIIGLCFLTGVWFVYSEIYTAQAVKSPKVTFQVKEGESVSALADRLDQEQVVRHGWLFKKYVAFKGIDKEIRFGTFEVLSPITLHRVVEVLGKPGTTEREITIIPGWDIRDIANYFENQGMFQAEEITELIGLPAVNYNSENIPKPTLNLDLNIAKDKPACVSFEGYIAPDTYRIYKDASLEEIMEKLIRHRDSQFTDQMMRDIENFGKDKHDILTMASILEREVQAKEDREKIADIFWRRYEMNWALQADSTVHYALGKKGEVFTTKEERDSLSQWNTYKYPGLPLGPICSPSIESIMAAIYPQKNDYWYFLTTPEGDVKYAETIEEHNENRKKYL